MKETQKLFTLIVLVFGFLIFITGLTFADTIEECMKLNNLTCTNCVILQIQLITGNETSEYVIGDYQTYRILIRNIGNNSINTTFIVKVYNPEGNQVGTVRKFQTILLPNESKIFIPNQTVKGDKVDIYPFDIVGTYKIVVSSTSPITFYRFFPHKTKTHFFYCRYTYQPTFTYHYDVISKAEKQWRDTLRNWQSETQKLNEKMLEINQTMLKISQTVYFLTIINVFLVGYTVFKEKFLRFTAEKIGTTILLFIIWVVFKIYEIVNFFLSPLVLFVPYLDATQQILLTILWQYFIACTLIWLKEKLQKQ